MPCAVGRCNSFQFSLNEFNCNFLVLLLFAFFFYLGPAIFIPLLIATCVGTVNLMQFSLPFIVHGHRLIV